MSHLDFNVSGCSSGSVSCPSLFPAPLPILKVEVPWHLPLARGTYAREGLQSYLASCRSRELDLRVNRLVSQCHLHPHQPFRNSSWLYVRGLADAISEEKVRGHFAAWGSVADVYFTGTEWLERNNCCCVPHLLLPVCSQVMT